MSLLTYAYAEQPQLTETTLNVGLVRPLTSPYTIFLNVAQLISSNNRFVNFFVYSMGRERVILWGDYDKQSKTFNIDNGCQYNPNQLYKMTMSWIEQDYQYLGNTVKNRPLELMNKYLGEAEGMSYDEYVQGKHLLAYLRAELDEPEYLRLYSSFPELPMDDVDLLEYMFDLEDKLKEHELTINRTDLNRPMIMKLVSSTRQQIMDISQKFTKAVETGTFYRDIHQQCPDYDKCAGNKVDQSCDVYFYGGTTDYT